jgi:hypothetical protein
MRMRRVWAVVTALLFAVIAGAPARAVQGLALVPVAATSQSGGGNTLLDVVMLVDESGSETPLSVAEEKAAAETITFGMLNPDSKVAVVGFGGVTNDNAVPPQNPIDPVCPPTTASQANEAVFSSCIGKLHRRNFQEGNDTDYGAALNQAMSYLGQGASSPPGALKLIVMLTDGGLDDSHTHHYGWPDWEAGAHHAINLDLAAAKAAGVQVWPLGFGGFNGVDQQYLDYLAASGAQSGCDTRPQAIVISTRVGALAAFDQLLGAATCSGPSTSQTILPGGQTRSLNVTIPVIASSAAISVYRADPRVSVAFYPPGSGTPGAFGPSAISGQGTATEVLRLANPPPGTWRVQLTAPAGMASELVSAAAFFQGAVNAYLNATPVVQPGQPVKVTLSVLRPNGEKVTDPGTLAQLRTAVTVTGDGLPGPVVVPVSNAGEGQGTATGVGDYTGTFTAPRTLGTLTFTGQAFGPDLNVTPFTAQSEVSITKALTATVQFPSTASVQAGQDIQGTIQFTNQSGQQQAVKLVLVTRYPGVTLPSPQGVVRVPSGSPQSTPFTVAFNSGSQPGTALVTVEVVDAANPGVVYASTQDTLQVTKKPGFVSQYLPWLIIGGLVLIAAIIYAVLARRERKNRQLVSGLVASLSRDSEPMGADLPAPAKRSDVFRFVIRDEAGRNARLSHAEPREDGGVFVARRGRPGRVIVIQPDGADFDIAAGAPGEPLPNGLRLAFRDTRRGRKRSLLFWPGGGGAAKPRPRPSRPASSDGADDRSRTGPASANGHRAAAPDPASPAAEPDDTSSGRAPDEWY